MVEVLEGGDERSGEAESFQSKGDEIAGERRKSGTEIEENKGRVGMLGGGDEGFRLNVDDVMKTAPFWDESALVWVGPLRSEGVEATGDEGSEDFGICVGARKGAGIVWGASICVEVGKVITFGQKPQECMVEAEGKRPSVDPRKEACQECVMNLCGGMTPCEVGDAVGSW